MTMKSRSISDGTKTMYSMYEKADSIKDTLKNVCPSTPIILVRVGFAGTDIWVCGGSKEDRNDLLAKIKISDFKKLKVEKTNGRNAVVIEYKLHLDNYTVAPVGTVWVDQQTG